MHQIDFWFDVISPYAHLAFHKLPQVLQGLSVSVRYRPVLFAGLLKHHGQLGPAEIAPKKLWTFRQVNWLAHAEGIPLHAPAVHPFNPLPLLRVLLALGPGDGSCNRYLAECAFAHVWQSAGRDASDPVRIEALGERLLCEQAQTADPPSSRAVADLLGSPSAKTQLIANGDEAVRLGLFGVPTIVWRNDHFWGFDSLPMLRARLQGEAWFETPAWLDAAPSTGVSRR